MTEALAPSEKALPAPDAPSRRYWVLAMLTLIYMFNHVDRQILVILLEPIKSELQLSDSDLGILTGIAFAAFYATLGIPVAIWADRGNRRNIIALSLTIWSAMTALSGLATSYVHLLLARMGVGVGEAGGTPPATSMIADLYRSDERATAMGIYTSGIGLGILAGFALGGFVYEAVGWRAAFFVAGLPGLALALLFRFTVREPIRGQADNRQADKTTVPVREAFQFIIGQRAFVWMLLGCLFICISSNAFLVFTSSYLQRAYGLTPGQIGVPLGLLIGGVGSIGSIAIGLLCDRLSARDLRWRPMMIAISSAVSVPFVWQMLQARTAEMAYAWYAVPCFLGLVYASIAYTAVQELVKVQMRSFAAAFLLFSMTLVGIGGGPWMAGVLSEFYAARGEAMPLARALEMMLLFNVASVFCLVLAARHYHAGVKRAAQS